jgi:glutathione peroxidase
MFRILAALAFSLLALPAAAMERFTFDSIDGGTYDSADWAGKPVLVVNTASRCGFTPQYEGLQTLYDRYRDRGLIVLAVPTDDFRQELGSEKEIKEFCELTYGLDMPMTTISHVRGDTAHPFYRWVAEANGFTPAWNFNKVRIGPDGTIARTYGSVTEPLAPSITDPIETMLGLR